jgi:branched-chain amino acid transport system permease protein
MDLLGQLLINGLANGAIYALMAVGFALVYNATHVFHLAHGAILTFAAYLFYVCVVVAKVALWVAVPVTIVGAAVLGVLVEVCVYAPIRRKGGGPAGLMIASLGLLVLLQNIFALVFSTDVLTVRTGSLTVFQVGALSFTSLHIAIGAVAIVVFLLLQAFLAYSKHGQAIRALADNPELAPVIGINLRGTYMMVVGLGSVLASVAAILLTWDLGVQPDMGFMIVFFSVVAVIIGGAGYLPGALIGAFVLGIVQQLSILQLDSRWQNGVVFAVVLAFLFFRPQGIFGSRLNVRRA